MMFGYWRFWVTRAVVISGYLMWLSLRGYSLKLFWSLHPNILIHWISKVWFPWLLSISFLSICAYGHLWGRIFHMLFLKSLMHYFMLIYKSDHCILFTHIITHWCTHSYRHSVCCWILSFLAFWLKRQNSFGSWFRGLCFHHLALISTSERYFLLKMWIGK